MSAMLSQWSPRSTPSTIKQLIIWTVAISLLSAIIQSILDQFNITPGPQDLLSLSWFGLDNGYLWQPITFLFVQALTVKGINFYFLFTLLFNMYLLWILGTSLIELVGKGAFLCFYFFCGIAAGLLTIAMMPILGQYAVLAGTAPVILALLTAWSMAFPENEILLFFLIPLKSKWVIMWLIGAILLVTLAQWDLIDLFLYFFAVFLGYAYATMAWGWQSPFTFTRSLDRAFAVLGLRLRRWLPAWGSSKHQENATQTKVVDITTGKALSEDDAFIDAMLAKISKYGEGALTWSEKRRMQQISERKRNEREKK